MAFRLAAICLGVLPFAAIELSLRALESPTASGRFRLLSEANNGRRLFARNEQSNRYEVKSDRLTLFCPDSFSATKSANTRRVFVLGGSTVQGRPYATPTAFSTWLRLSLQASNPERNWEVVNCGGVSYASYRLAAVMAEVCQYQPDLVVLYTGHNEFLERQTFGLCQDLPAWCIEMLDQASRLRTVRCAEEWFHVGEQLEPSTRDLLQHNVNALLDDQGGLDQYHRNTPSRPMVERCFAANVSAMISYCKEQSIPLILCCPASNLADCPPFKSEFDPSLDAAQRARLGDLLAKATASDSPIAERIAAMRKAKRIDPRHPDVAYRLGKMLLQTGNVQEAFVELTIAADDDSCPLRIRSSMQRCIRELAVLHQVPLVDVDALLRAASRDGIVGGKLMVDHVHPTIEGHQMIADAIYETIQRQQILDVQHDPQHKLRRAEAWSNHLRSLDEPYFVRGKQRLAGLQLWAAGRSRRPH